METKIEFELNEIQSNALDDIIKIQAKPYTENSACKEIVLTFLTNAKQELIRKSIFGI